MSANAHYDQDQVMDDEESMDALTAQIDLLGEFIATISTSHVEGRRSRRQNPKDCRVLLHYDDQKETFGLVITYTGGNWGFDTLKEFKEEIWLPLTCDWTIEETQKFNNVEIIGEYCLAYPQNVEVTPK